MMGNRLSCAADECAWGGVPSSCAGLRGASQALTEAVAHFRAVVDAIDAEMPADNDRFMQRDGPLHTAEPFLVQCSKRQEESARCCQISDRLLRRINQFWGPPS
jgi:hypothetical protein